MLSHSDEALRLQSEGDLLTALRFWRQIVDLDEVSDDLKHLIGTRILQLQEWHRRKTAIEHLNAGREYVQKRRVIRGWLAYRKADEWLPEHDPIAPVLYAERKYAQKNCALIGAVYLIALSFVGLSAYELSVHNSADSATTLHTNVEEENKALWQDLSPDNAAIETQPDQLQENVVASANDPHVRNPSAADSVVPQQLVTVNDEHGQAVSGNNREASQQPTSWADLGLTTHGRGAVWSLAGQEAILQLLQPHGSQSASYEAAYRLRLLRVQALSAYHFLPRTGLDPVPFERFLSKYAGTNEAVDVYSRLSVI